MAKAKTRILYDARIAPPDTDLADEASLRAGLEFVYEDAPWADIEAMISRIWKTSSKVDDSKRKYLNWPTASSDSWVDPQDWAQMARPGVVPADGEDVVLFFDGSMSNDHTALIGARMGDGHIFTVGVWAPTQDTPDDRPMIDYEVVDAAVDRAHKRWSVVAFFADVREWEAYVHNIWPERYKESYRLWASTGGRKAAPIAWDMRSHDYDFTQASELVEQEIRQHLFTHDGDPRLTQHVLNMRRHEGRFGIVPRKESRKSLKKIDAGVCMIGARMVWALAKQKAKKKRSGKRRKAVLL